MDDRRLKYQILMDYIKKQIATGTINPGEKIPSEAELTEVFGMSRQTVRKAIQELQYDGYLYTEKGRGSFVSPLDNRQRNGPVLTDSKLIGILVAFINDTIFPPILHGIEEILSRNGYSIFWGSTHNEVEREAEALMKMLKHNLAGIIVEPSKSAQPNPNIYLYEQLEKNNIPTVFIHAFYSNHLNPNYVIVDDVDAGRKAVNHLIENGHKKIGGIFKADDIQGHKRYQGFLNGIQAAGLDLRECKVTWIDDTFDWNSSQFTTSLQKKYQTHLQNSTAIVCYNDDLAIALTKILLNLGLKVPDDCSLIGFDNTRHGELTRTPFTSMDHPKQELGRLAAESLIKKINNPNIQIQEKMIVELVEKMSVKNLKQPNHVTMQSR